MCQKSEFLRFNRIFILIIGVSFVSCNLAYGYRGDPKPVSPVEYEGIRFGAPAEKMAYVEGRDAKTGKLLWEKLVYNVKTEYGIEKAENDDALVYINYLKIEGENLIVTNEKNEQFILKISDIKNELVKFSEMLEADLTRYPFLKFECRKENCKSIEHKDYVFYEKIHRYPESLVGEHDLFELENNNIVQNARAYYSVYDCGNGFQVFMINLGGELESVSSEEFYRYLFEQGDLLQAYSFRNVTIIERVE